MSTQIDPFEASTKFSFITQVEVYDVEKNHWKVLNYISNKEKLSILYPGVVQVSSQRLMIFGGIISASKKVEEQESDGKEKKSGTGEGKGSELHTENLVPTANCFYMNVTNGTMKRGPDLMKESYYFGGGGTIPQSGKIFAFGFAPPVSKP